MLLRKIIIFLLFSFLLVNCSHKEIKEKIEDIPIIKEEDITDDIELLYNRFVEAIMKKKIDEIAKCYSEDAIFQYSDEAGKEISCFDKSKKIEGIENIKKNYDYLFKTRYLNRIEYEIVRIYRDTNPKKVIFMNLWFNVEFDFYEIIECVLIDKKYYIKSHTIVKGKEIRDSFLQ